jgi:hypothetical protein
MNVSSKFVNDVITGPLCNLLEVANSNVQAEYVHPQRRQ